MATIVASLIQELETKVASLNTEDMFLTKIKLMEAAKMFRVSVNTASYLVILIESTRNHSLIYTFIFSLQQRYSQNPLTLFRIIKHCLNTEMKLVSQDEIGGNAINIPCDRINMILGDSVAEISQQLEILRRRTYECGEDLRKLEQEQEAFSLSYHECTKLNAHLQQLTTQPHSQQNIEIEKKIRR